MCLKYPSRVIVHPAESGSRAQWIENVLAACARSRVRAQMGDASFSPRHGTGSDMSRAMFELFASVSRARLLMSKVSEGRVVRHPSSGEKEL
jgi:hypothetical protein